MMKQLDAYTDKVSEIITKLNLEIVQLEFDKINLTGNIEKLEKQVEILKNELAEAKKEITWQKGWANL